VNPLASRHLRRSIFAIGLATTLLASLSFAQTETPATPSATNPCTPASPINNPPSTPPTPPPCRAKHHTDTSISLGLFPQLTIDRTSDFYGFSQQGTAPSTGTLGTFRQTFRPWLGYSINLGYSRVSEQYRNASAPYYGLGDFNIDANMYESSITYIAHTPVNKHFSLFGEIGPGLLTFLPVHRGADAIDYAPNGFAYLIPNVQVRPTGVFGSGIDLHLTRRFDLRAEYRGLFYKNPDFNTGDYPYSKQLTLTSEPTISLVYHLHQPKP
jgi:hypothetical protein